MYLHYQNCVFFLHIFKITPHPYHLYTFTASFLRKKVPYDIISVVYFVGNAI